MSATGFLVLLIVSIAILMVLIMKVKLHPTFALFISALFMGLVLGRFEAEGFGFTDILTTITGGFGGTLGSMGIPIMLGAILAMGVQDTGAAKAIANFFIKLFRGKNLELAPALTAYIVSIPVFGDITTILTSNIANVLSKRKHISMGKMAAFTPDRSEPDPCNGSAYARYPGCIHPARRRPRSGHRLGHPDLSDRVRTDLAGSAQVDRQGICRAGSGGSR